MIRPSSLSLAEKCGLSPVLSAEFPEINANIERGNLVDTQVSRRLLGGMPATDPDALAILEWMQGMGFFGVGAYGFSQETVELVDPDSHGVLTRGTADYAHYDQGVVTIVDYKKREQYAAGRLADPDDNMQLHAYGLAWALRMGAHSYKVVLLLFGDGKVEPIWCRKIYTPENWVPFLDRIRRLQVDDLVRADLKIRPQPTAGDHCAQCYPRLHCPSWMFPEPLPSAEGSALVPLSKPGGITKSNAGDLLLYVMAVEEQAKRAREVLKNWAIENGGAIEVGDRKWSASISAGRKSGPSVEELEGMGLGHLVKQGRPFESWRIGKR